MAGAVEVARHRRSTPGSPMIDDAHYPPRPAGALGRQPKASNPAEAEFLTLGEGARLWLVEAAATGTAQEVPPEPEIPTSDEGQRLETSVG